MTYISKNKLLKFNLDSCEYSIKEINSSIHFKLYVHGNLVIDVPILSEEDGGNNNWTYSPLNMHISEIEELIKFLTH